MTHGHAHDSERDPTLAGTASLRLRTLSRLTDYEIADGDPDIRDWTVFDACGAAVGGVHDLVVDMETLDVRYMVMGMRSPGWPSERRHVLIPIGLVRLSDDVAAVMLPGVDAALLASLPHLDDELLTRDWECELLGAFVASARSASDLGPTFYDQPQFDCARLRGGRTTPRARAYAVAPRSYRR